jgi:hypothetical protein
MKLPKSAPGVTRGMSALSGYIGQVGVEPSYSSCRWDGTAPFCKGQCLPGEIEVNRSFNAGSVAPMSQAAGFGAMCASGTKAYCCRP